ncbi:hypothetical protein P4B35_22270 [Pontiellaceae bacterium B12227]|nr:hypothetical protein [Pontiellaceae bacterium B12227]
MEIRLHPKKIVLCLSIMVVLLFFLHCLSYLPVFLDWCVIPLIPLNFDCEGNLPTLFSSFLLGFCALLACICAWAARKQGLKSFHWWLMAIIFLGISIDESIQFHEAISGAVQDALNTGGYLLFAWVIPYSVLVVVIVAFYIPFFFRLPIRMRKWMALGALLYVAGGLGVELPESYRYDHYGEDKIYHALVTLEELLEMTGCITFIYALSSHIDRHIPNISLRITSE